MEEREREKRVEKGSRTIGEESPLNRWPRKSGCWAQIGAGPVVPPYANLRTNGTLRKPAGPVLLGRSPVLPPQTKQATNGSL